MVSIIVAISKNNCIGKGGKLPWHLLEDMKRFKELTMGKVVVMGRKTWESLPEKFRPLPGRHNVVITRQTDYKVSEGIGIFSSLHDALHAHAGEEIMVIGGAEIYAQALPLADKLEITEIEQTIDGCDAFFPQIDQSLWRETAREDRKGFSWVTYNRRR